MIHPAGERPPRRSQSRIERDEMHTFLRALPTIMLALGISVMQPQFVPAQAPEVHIFPESSRGTGEGHRPWDLQPGSTMTNANVEKVEQVMVEKAQGQLLTLKYKDGEQKVLISPGTPIVRNVPGDRSLLKPGT